MCLFLCSCDRNRSSVVSNSDTNDSTEYIDFSISDSEQFSDTKLNIALITKGYDSSYWESLIKGARNSAEDNNVNILFAGIRNENNTDKLAELIEKSIDLKVDAIVLSPADTIEINTAISKALSSGIHIVYVDTILNGSNFDACYMTDNIEAGRIVATEMIKKLQACGHCSDEELIIGIEIGSLTSQTIIERLAGFNEYWANNAPACWNVVDHILCNEGQPDVAYTQCLDLMSSCDNLCGLIGLNNGSTVGMCKAIKERNRKDLAIIGFDYSTEIAELIMDKEYNVSTMVQCQYDMGYNGVTAAVNICNGEFGQFKYFDTGIAKIDSQNYNSSYVKKLVSTDK